MKCFASLVILALACVACAAPTTEHKLLSESSGQFVKVDPTTGTVTADASQNDASGFTITLPQPGKLRFENSGRFLGITASGAIKMVTGASEGDVELEHVMTGSDPNTFGLKVQRDGSTTCFVGFQSDGQPVDNACTGLSTSSVETYLVVWLD